MESSAGPTIYKSAVNSLPSSQTLKNSNGWFKKNIVKILLVVLGVAVVGELIFGAVTLFSPATVRNLNVLQPDMNELGGAKFSLVADKASYKKGDAVVIEAKVFTGGYTTDSADLVVKYDPAFLKPISENFVSVGQIYSEYPPVQVDNQTGLVGISGITLASNSGFLGVGSFARLNFTALKDGQTDVIVDYQPDSTADSNIVLSGSMQDVLSGADNAQVVVSGTEAAVIDSGQKCDAFTQSCQDSSGRVGTQICKAGTINNGSCSYDAKQTLTCEVCSVQ